MEMLPIQREYYALPCAKHRAINSLECHKAIGFASTMLHNWLKKLAPLLNVGPIKHSQLQQVLRFMALIKSPVKRLSLGCQKTA